MDIKNNIQLNKLLDFAGKDLAPMLLKSVNGRISSWAVKLAFSQIYYNKFTLFPVVSLTENIGVDASGTNFRRRVKKYNVKLSNNFDEFHFPDDLKVELKIIKQIRRIVQPGPLSYLKYRLFNSY